MQSVNTSTLLGRLVDSPESKQLPNTLAANFTVATNRRYKNSNGEIVEESQFTKCTAYWKVAEIIAEHWEKWKAIYVSGRLETTKYEQDWAMKYITKIVVRDFVFPEAKS
jgi:single-strand DNA-binding protein